MPVTYDYSFQCVLPPNLPSSYNNYNGHTKYSARVTINIPLWRDKTFKRNFIVYKTVDLNDFPRIQVIHFEFNMRQGNAVCVLSKCEL